MKTARIRVRHLAVAASLAAVAWLSVPASPEAQSGGVTSVSFLAVGPDGRPVADLKAEDVQITLNRRPRPIKSFKRIEGASAGAGEAAKPAASALPPPFGTNLSGGGGAATGRTIFFLIEDASFRPGNERLAKQAISKYLDEISPADRVALLTMPLASVRVEPTGREQVREALNRVNGVALQKQTNDDLACRARETLEAMAGLFTSLAGADTPSTTVMFFSSGMSGSTRTTGQMGGNQACDLSTDHFQKVAAASAAARVQLYVIQGDLTVTQRSDGLENLAGVSGGKVIVLAAAGDNPLNRVALETSASFVAAFEPDASERNGQNHRLEIRVNRPDVSVRSPELILIPKGGGGARSSSPSARDMLREATVYRDLPLRVAGYASRDAADKVKIVTLAEPVDPSTKLTSAVVAIYDAKGKLTAQSTIPNEQLGSLPIMAALVAAPGTYRLRLAATDASGKSGSADYNVTAELVSAGDLKVSALMLSAPGPGGEPAPAMQFRNEETATAFFELYGKPPAQLALKLELAATPDGPAIEQVPPAGSGTKDPDRFTITGTFNIAKLAPGDYVVRAIVGPAGQEGKLFATLRKVK